MASQSKQSQSWLIRKLKPHPRQAETFPDLPDADLDALAADMAANGLQHPIEILPGGVILAGHQRVRAAKKLGWKEIDVVVRHDLAAAGDVATTAYFIGDNLNRRQLSPLAKARCVAELIELEAGRRIEDMYGEDRDNVKKTVAQRMGMSQRNLNRYLLALKAPLPIQMAFERGHLSLTEVGDVALLDKTVAESLADKVEALNAEESDDRKVKIRVREEFCAALISESETSSNTKASLYRLVRALKRELPIVRGAVEQIETKTLARLRDVMAEAQSLFAALQKRAG